MRIVLLLLLMLFSAIPGRAANSSKNFGGVGIDGVPWADGSIVVKQIVLGGPAQRAGIHVGDVITHIDGKPTAGDDFKHIVEYRLRGRAGTKVMIRVRRPGRVKPLNFTLTRRQLAIPVGRQKALPKEE